LNSLIFSIKMMNLVDKIFPLNTKRGLVIRLTYKVIKRPKLLLNILNLKNIKKFIYYYNTLQPDTLYHLTDINLSDDDIVSNLNLSGVKDPKDLLLDEISDLFFSPPSMPFISIIIPIYNQWRYTYNCLVSILENTEGHDYEVILVNDCSSDETSLMLNKIHGISVINNLKNMGFINNCNNASLAANGKYLVFLNNDTYVTKGWLNVLISTAQRDNKIGVIGAKLIFPNGKIQEAGGIMWKDGTAWNYGRGDLADKAEYNFLREIDYCSGACLLISRDLFIRSGLFDIRYYPAYYEDSDLCMSVRKLGYKIIYQPQSVVVHYEGISSGKDVSTGVKRYQEINREKFLQKWKSELNKYHSDKNKDFFLARDRSQNRKHILFIENNVPKWDKDAGSLTIFNYIMLFKKIGFQVSFIPDNLIPLMPYTNVLLQNGVEVMYGKSSFSSWIRENGKYIDVAWLARPDVSIKYVYKINKFSNANILYYVHDLHYLREQRHYLVEKNPAILREANRLKKVEFEIFDKCDIVLTPSYVEKRVLSSELPEKHIEVIPPYIDFENKDLQKYSNIPFDEREHLIFLGGFSHTPNLDSILWFINDIFPILIKMLPNVKLFVIGNDPPESLNKLASSNIVITGYVRDLATHFSKAKVFIAPLRYGAGVKGKIVTSMSYGVPVVTTSIGNEGIGLEDSEEIMIADEPNLFAQKIYELYTNKDIWNKIAYRSLNRYKENFSVTTATNRIFSILNLTRSGDE
jgi:O-antigen biosynthesis protein